MQASSSLNGPSHESLPRPAKVGYLVSHPIQYQAPLLRRLSCEPDIDLTVLFGSDFSVRGYKDEGFGVEVAWDVPLLEGYKYEFLKPLRDAGGVSPMTPISRNILGALTEHGQPRFDVLWVHGYASINSLQAIAAAKALGIPVMVRAESWLGDRPRSSLKLWAKNAFFYALSKFVDAVLPIGTHNDRYWAQYLPTVPRFLVPYAVDNDYFARRTEEAKPHLSALREELSLDLERPVILFASKLIERKHALDLLCALELLLKRGLPGPRPYLVLVGDGDQRAALEAFADRAGIRGDVRFAGFRNQSELSAFFALATVFVLPSRHEPWGLIVNEAMAAGCAVILSDEVGAAADLVANGSGGVVFPAGDTQALAHALEQVLRTPETYAVMATAAKLRMHTWSFEEDVRGLRAAIAHTTHKLRP